MGKMMMEAGDWLGHGEMVRGGALTVQVRDLERKMLLGEGAVGESGHGESRGMPGGIKFGTKIGKVHAVLVIKYCFGIHGALVHKIICLLFSF